MNENFKLKNTDCAVAMLCRSVSISQKNIPNSLLDGLCVTVFNPDLQSLARNIVNFVDDDLIRDFIKELSEGLPK